LQHTKEDIERVTGLQADHAEHVAKVAAAGGCPKCGSPNVLIPSKDPKVPRQCLNCGNKYEFDGGGHELLKEHLENR